LAAALAFFLLSGLKPYTDKLTAVVTLSDEGGSSGRLSGRSACLRPEICEAVCWPWPKDDTLLSRSFNIGSYKLKIRRFLGRHSFGNLFLTALTVSPEGSTRHRRGRACFGDPRPRFAASVQPVRLSATLVDGRRVLGKQKFQAAPKPFAAFDCCNFA